MSDFIYSTKSNLNALEEALLAIYSRDQPAAQKYSGEWGSVVVLENHYRGFAPYEDSSHLAIVLGGPVLEFRDNDFLDEPRSSAGTEALLRRFLFGDMRWDRDLSGPFACLFIEKMTKKVIYVTDLLMFIPIYTFFSVECAVVGSHPDAVARAACQSAKIDLVSTCDFILNHAVTHPHTLYREVWQAEAGTIHAFHTHEEGVVNQEKTNYWEPRELILYRDIEEAACALRSGVMNDIRRITGVGGRVAAFLSPGEDSRSVVSFLPEGVQCDGFTYLYKNSREQNIVSQVAGALGMNSYVREQPFYHYLEILSDASALVGSGHQYSHAHVYGFTAEWGLKNYRAVFGGYASDTLLKGLFSRKAKGRGLLKFLPEIPLSGETRTQRQFSPLFTEEALIQVQSRRKIHMARVQAIRPETAHEWFHVWPASMNVTFPYFLATRRLMRSYEPFTGRVSVQVGSGVPLHWKLNRRMFQKTFKPALERTRRIFHGDGHLPYHPFCVNVPFVFVHKLRDFGDKLHHALTGWFTGREAPWDRRRAAKDDAKWQTALRDLLPSQEVLRAVIREPLSSKSLSSSQMRNLIQVLDWVRCVVVTNPRNQR